MKKIFIGIVIGVCLTLALSVCAEVAQYILTKADYPLWVKDKEYVSEDLPILNYEGNTYVPMRKLGDILGVKVDWNEELGRAEVGMTEKKEETVVNEREKIPGTGQYKKKIDERFLTDGWISEGHLDVVYGVTIEGHFEPPHFVFLIGSDKLEVPVPVKLMDYTKNELPIYYDLGGIKIKIIVNEGRSWHIDTLRQLGIAE